MAKDDLQARIVEKIMASPDIWGSKARRGGKHLSGLTCPECGKPEAWAYADRPMAILCNRKNECGAKVNTLELFPELLMDIERDFAPTKADRHRPATEYLHSRLLRKSLAGLQYEYWKDVRKTGGGGVMFPLGKGMDGKPVWNGRLFNPPVGEGKTHNAGKTEGMFWRHPGLQYDSQKPVYVVEGIIDALSLIEMGLQSIAVLSVGQDPTKIDLGELQSNIVIAFDPDSAGAGGLKKWRQVYPSAKAITPVQGDWNDLLRQNGAEEGEKRFQEMLPEFETRAGLLLAESAREYAEIYRSFYGRCPGLFVFDRRYCHATENIKTPELGPVVSHVSDFTVSVDHYRLEFDAHDEPRYRYHLKVKPRKGAPVACSVTGSDLAKPWSMRATFLEKAKVMWEGEAKPSASLASMIASAPAPVVRQVHVLGYDSKSGCHVFEHFLLDTAGKVVFPDKKGFFRANRKEYLRPSNAPSIRPKKGIEMPKVYELVQTAWPDNGALAMAFTVASWFVHGIKHELGFFPFLSLHGDTQTGKTRLVRILNALQCCDEEGLPMTKLNTGKGEIRKLAQRASLFKALLEGNNEDKVRFDMESLLTLYNCGNALQVRAVKSNDIQTHDTDFLATMVFVQNKEPFKGKAQMERVVSSRMFSTDDITPATTEAFNKLVRIPNRELAYMFPYIMQHRKHIESTWEEQYSFAREEIFGVVSDNRLAENHGLILAFHRILTKLLGVSHDLLPFMLDLAARKQEQCAHRNATLADAFFEAISELSEETRAKFIELKDKKMMVRLPLALKTLDGHGYRFIQAQMMNELREHPAFISSRVTYRGYFDKQVSELVKVWVFDPMKVI
jgi:hypothetical protein